MWRPDWWTHPARCQRGHAWGARPCDRRPAPCDAHPPAQSAREERGHLTVRCRAADCSSIWYPTPRSLPPLAVSETTVKTHVGSVLTNFDLRDRIQVVVYAYETGAVRLASLARTCSDGRMTRDIRPRDRLEYSAARRSRNRPRSCFPLLMVSVPEPPKISRSGSWAALHPADRRCERRCVRGLSRGHGGEQVSLRKDRIGPSRMTAVISATISPGSRVRSPVEAHCRLRPQADVPHPPGSVPECEYSDRRLCYSAEVGHLGQKEK